MLEQQSKNFKTEYQRMIDEELFERTPFVNQCERDAQGTRRYPEVKEYLKTAKDFAHYLPERSDKYIDEIIEFEHYEDSSYINQLRLQALPELRLLRAGTLVLMRTLLTI
jgi:hypothetical protein